MFKSSITTIAVIVSALSGCASLPDATVRYYLAKTKLNVRVIRTVSCDGGNQLVIANAVTPTVLNVADTQQVKHVALAGLKGTLSDSDVKFGFYDDGRLKDFNASSTGQGESILKTVIQLAPLFFGFDQSDGHPTECADIKKRGGEKPLTITYGGEIDLSSPGTFQIKPDPTGLVYAGIYERLIGRVCATVGPRVAAQVPVDAHPSGVRLELREPAAVHVQVFAGGAGACNEGPVWESDVMVAQLGTDYSLPIPTPVLFGKQVMAASFAESGALTSVQFTSNTGAGQLLNVANAAQGAAKPESATQKAADLKAEADLIAQQQRLVQCIADPKNCR